MSRATPLSTSLPLLVAVATCAFALDYGGSNRFNPIELPDKFNFSSDEWPNDKVELRSSGILVNFDESRKQDSVANKCYADDSGTLLFCIYAANVSRNAIEALSSNYKDCLSQVSRIGEYDRCRDYQITDAYHSWFRLQCGVRTSCINPDVCRYETDNSLMPYADMPNKVTVPYATLMNRDSADRQFFINRCKRSDLYRVVSDFYDCVYPPYESTCKEYHDRTETTTTTTTTEKPVDPEDPSVCSDIADCDKANGTESNLIPNNCDCHRFWQCQPQIAPNQKWVVSSKICPYRDNDDRRQYFDVSLKVCKNDRNDSVSKCENY